MIDLARLRVLHAVATYGTVTSAARALYLTPSAVSQHLAKLERETGSALLEKDGRGLRLTEAGRVLVRHAANVLAAVEEAEAALAAHRDTVTGRLVIAAFPTACRSLAPVALSRLLAEHPGLEPALREGGNAISLDLVARGEADVAVIDEWPEAPVELPSGVSHVDLGPDVADLVVPAGHPLAAAGPVRLTDVVRERWVAATPGSICHDWLTRALPSVRPAFHVDEFETQLTLIAAGLGVAVIPRLARTRLPDGVAVVPVEPVPTRRVGVAWRAASGARPAISAAIDALRHAWRHRATG